MMYTVYKHTTPSEKVYIGITSKSPEERWLNGRGYQNNRHFTQAIQKYGWDNIQHEILATGLSKHQAENMEIELIARYDTTNPNKGYNNTHGGECIGKHTDVSKKLMSDIRKRQYRSGELTHPMKGKHFSEESKQKMRNAHANKVLSEEHKRKISASAKGQRLGSDNHISRKVRCVETGETFDSITQASESIGVTRVAVSRCVRGQSHTAGGFRWEYAT